MEIVDSKKASQISSDKMSKAFDKAFSKSKSFEEGVKAGCKAIEKLSKGSIRMYETIDKEKLNLIRLQRK